MRVSSCWQELSISIHAMKQEFALDSISTSSKRTCKYLVPAPASNWMSLGCLDPRCFDITWNLHLSNGSQWFHLSCTSSFEGTVRHRFCILFSSLTSRNKNPKDHGPCGLWKTWVVAWILNMYPGMKSNKVFKQTAHGERGHAVSI